MKKENKNSSNKKILIIKSTVPPSTASEIIKPYIEKAGFICGKDTGLANNPEFLREGYAWEDFINPDRIVIGCEDEESGLLLEDLYKCFNSPVFKVSLNTAEFIKYLSNTLLSTLISFSMKCPWPQIQLETLILPKPLKSYIWTRDGMAVRQV